MAKVLLIESDRQVAANIRSFLMTTGHKVRWQVELQAALDTIDSFRPDVVVLDLLLAGRSGAEFLYELRSYADWENLPVIVFSSVEQIAEQNLNHLNIAAFLYKPSSSLAELSAAIDQLQPVKQ